MMERPEGQPGKPTVEEIVADLAGEHAALDDIVADLAAHGWSLPTPSTGWSVADQIGHLAYFDRAAALAIREPDAFAAEVAQAFEAIGRGEDPLADVVEQARTLDHAELLASWRHARAELLTAAGDLAAGSRLPWYGPSMGAVSFLTARLMETWAHGHDVAEALGVERVATDRLRHVAQLGVITRGWSYGVRGATPPAEAVGTRLRAPSGAMWVWGGEADQWVEGDALDFCLVVTQRRNVADTRLTVHGPAAADWMRVAQAFAGGPTLGPPPRRLG
jgi:uncharacterized protein (TIGR03084 family)